MSKVIYEAFFIQDNLESKLSNDVEYKHITTEFRPSKTHEHLYGKMATFNVYAYGNDDINEGYAVKMISCDDNELWEIYNGVDIPHLTLSTSAEGKPINTVKIEFEFIDNFTITTKFGGFIGRPIFEEINKI